MWAGYIERARDGQPDSLGEEFPNRQIKRPGLFYQLARNRDRHLCMTFRLELYPRSSTALMGVVQLGLVQCGGDIPHLSPFVASVCL
jgi:hypothetical protein